VRVRSVAGILVRRGKVGQVGDEIDAAPGERDAADQPFECEPGAATGSMNSDGFFGVAGAGGVELAVPSEERREVDAIGVHEREKKSGAEGGVRENGLVGGQGWSVRRSLRSSADRSA
jgi:hypothetical protein